MFRKMNDKDFDYLRNITSPNRVYIQEQIATDFTHDELGTVISAPEVHIQVINKQEVADIMKYAYKEELPVTVRGAGTGLVGAAVAVSGGILLDTIKMNHILELDKENLTLLVEPGVLLLDIYDYVEKEGLFYAPDPGEKTATIGGNIACNAGGMRAVKYGVTRDWVRGLEVVLANGEIINLGGKVVKNSTGYDLKDLIIGSEGTLGIVVSATLKLIPKTHKLISLLVPFASLEAAISAAPKIMIDHIIPTGLEIFEKSTIKNSEEFLGKKIPNGNYEAYLLISYDESNIKALKEDIEIISKLCVEKYDAIDAFLVDTDERKNNIWTVRGGFLEAIKASTPEMDECDVVLPRSNIAEFLSYTKVVSHELKMRIPYFGHIGDGNLHIYLCKDNMTDQAYKTAKEKGFNLLYKKAYELGGLISGEHGIGYAKRTYLAEMTEVAHYELMKGIKRVFDPKGILNPQKVV